MLTPLTLLPRFVLDSLDSMADVAQAPTQRGLAPARPTPEDLKTSRTIHGHTGQARPSVPNPSKHFTNRAGTPLPPPPRPEAASPRRAAPAAAPRAATPPQAVDPAAPVARTVAEPVSAPVVVEYKADPNSSKNVHVNDRKHRGASRNVLGGFFTS